VTLADRLLCQAAGHITENRVTDAGHTITVCTRCGATIAFRDRKRVTVG
jgi:hypothetical protein